MPWVRPQGFDTAKYDRVCRKPAPFNHPCRGAGCSLSARHIQKPEQSYSSNSTTSPLPAIPRCCSSMSIA